ncbi:hypothetical protein PGH12_10720 [Chryseobacterium wangxinyae]|uniref:hypothetical protein n=1 Tax=Chryseobacterium sp. CY350 TaxID=2997336 RepID=UPI00226E2A59|nr:hypothetical protein [Chryseobacterium sp. CY350]MCY0978669.1 hypothetical protein [Chryseobacterium sp. CY350]WBZ93949.1 hypothetical protein PGH12_10720 [Chryseobacterium sp. CY350]
MKNVLSLITIFLFTIFYSQELKNFIIPKGYEKILEVKGDLDKDGKEENVVVFNTNIQTKSEGVERKFYILKKIGGILKIWKENSTIILPKEIGFSPESNPLPEITIKKGILIITQSFSTNSRHTQTYKHTYRYQNGDFYLIGSLQNFDDTCEFNMYDEINFSTGKAIVDQKYYPCFPEDKTAPAEDFHKEFNYKLKKLIKMNNFKPGENSIRIPNSDKHLQY